MIAWEQHQEGHGWFHDVGSERDAYTWPGVVVHYGRERDKTQWYVVIELAGEYIRRSDPFETDTEARQAAEVLVRALRGLWPEVSE